MSQAILELGSTNLLIYDGLVNGDTGAYVNDATITGTLKDAAGADIGGVGVSWPVNLTYDGGAKGRYRAELPDTLAVAEGDVGTAEYAIADSTGTLKKTVSLPWVAARNAGALAAG